MDQPGVLGYAVFRDPAGSLSLSEEPVNRVRITGTSYVDTLPAFAGDSAGFEYRVRVMDEEGDYGPAGEVLEVMLPSRNLTTTRIVLDSVGTVFSIRDTARLAARFENPTRRIAKLEWIDAGGKVLQGGSPGARSGRDTLVYALPAQPGSRDVTLRLVDDAGHEWKATARIEVIQDEPQAHAGADTSVFFRDSLTLRGGGTDGIGRIVKWEWDVGATGTFADAPGGVLKAAPRGAMGEVRCVLRVTDDDGNTATDTKVLTIVKSRLIAPMLHSRFRPAAAVLGGKVYVMGGNQFANGQKMEVFDPATGAWTHDTTMPYPREKFTLHAVAGRLYVLGGWVNNQPTSGMHRYDPATKQWAPVAEVTSGHRASSYHVDDGKILAIRRYQVQGGYEWQASAQYLPDQDRWEELQAPRGWIDEWGSNPWRASYANWGGKIYAPKAVDFDAFVLDQHTFITSGSSTKAIFTGRRDGLLVPLGSRIYLVGVREFPINSAVNTPQAGRFLDWFDPAANAWTDGGDLVVPRMEPAVVQLGDRLLVIGGRSVDWSGGRSWARWKSTSRIERQDMHRKPALRTLPALLAGLALAACNDDGDPAGSSLAVKGLALAAYDTLKGHATLTWDEVDRPGVLGYAVFRDRAGALALSDEPVNGARITGTSYVDTVPPITGDSAVYEYRVKVLDQEGDYGPAGEHLTVTLPGARRVTTTLGLEYPRSGLSIRDTVRIVARFANPTRRTVQVRWSDHDGKVRTLQDPRKSGSDTLVHVLPSEAGTRTLHVLAVDEAGVKWAQSASLDVLLDAPQANAGADTSIFFRDSLTLRGRASDGLGRIAKWEWDVGATGSFTEAPGGLLKAAAPGRTGDLRCVLRVTDDDGLTATDEAVLRLTRARLVAPMTHARFDPAVAALGGKLYVMGGNSFQKGLEMEVYDPATGAWSHETTMPYLREKFQLLAVAGRLYVLGGLSNSHRVPWLHSYDPATRAWSERAPLPDWSSDSWHVADGKIVGVLFFRETIEPRWMVRVSYDPAADRWETPAQLPDMGYVRGPTPSHTYWGGRIYAAKPIEWDAYALDRYVFLTRGSRTMAVLDGRKDGRLLAGKDRIYLVGTREDGSTGPSADPAATLRLDTFDPVADAWTAGTPSSSPAWGPASASWTDGSSWWAAASPPSRGRS